MEKMSRYFERTLKKKEKKKTKMLQAEAPNYLRKVSLALNRTHHSLGPFLNVGTVLTPYGGCLWL